MNQAIYVYLIIKYLFLHTIKMIYLLKYPQLTATTDSLFSQWHKRKIVIVLIETIQLMVIISPHQLVSIYINNLKWYSARFCCNSRRKDNLFYIIISLKNNLTIHQSSKYFSMYHTDRKIGNSRHNLSFHRFLLITNKISCI